MEEKKVESYKIVKKLKKKVAKPKVIDDTAERIASFNAEIYKAIRKHASINSGFVLAEEYEGGFVISKTAVFNVKKTVGKGVFYQHETYEDKKISYNTIVEYVDYPDRTEWVNDLFKSGCPVVEVGSSMQVKEILDAM